MKKILVITSAILLLAAACNKQPAPVQPAPPPEPLTQNPAPTPDPTANWKTYSNSQYGLEIKYPEDSISKGSWSGNGGFFFVAFGPADTIDSKPIATLKIYPNQSTLDKFVKYFDYVKGTWKDTMLNNTQAKEIVLIGQNSKESILIASVKNSFGYQFEADNQELLNNMVSTFRFTK